MELVPLPEGEEPDRGTNNEDDDGVEDENPVECDEAEGDVVTLDDSKDRKEPGDNETDTEDEAACLSLMCSFDCSIVWNFGCRAGLRACAVG